MQKGKDTGSVVKAGSGNVYFIYFGILISMPLLRGKDSTDTKIKTRTQTQGLFGLALSSKNSKEISKLI